MSSIATSPAQISRPASVSAAVVLSILLNVASLPLVFILPGADEIPAPAIAIGVITGLVSVVAAWGMWNLRRWGAITTFVVTLLNTVSSIPGFFNPPSDWILALLIVTTPISIALMVLIAMPSTRKVLR